MDWKLELIVVPVSDVDRAKEFYAERAGFGVDVDHRQGDFRVVQLSPPGSACAIALMPNRESAGTLNGLHLVVSDALAAHDELVARGVEVRGPFHFSAGGETEGLDPERRDYNTFLHFSDPDGNGWLVQEVRSRG